MAQNSEDRGVLAHRVTLSDGINSPRGHFGVADKDNMLWTSMCFQMGCRTSLKVQTGCSIGGWSCPMSNRQVSEINLGTNYNALYIGHVLSTKIVIKFKGDCLIRSSKNLKQFSIRFSGGPNVQDYTLTEINSRSACWQKLMRGRILGVREYLLVCAC